MHIEVCDVLKNYNNDIIMVHIFLLYAASGCGSLIVLDILFFIKSKY